MGLEAWDREKTRARAKTTGGKQQLSCGRQVTCADDIYKKGDMMMDDGV